MFDVCKNCNDKDEQKHPDMGINVVHFNSRTHCSFTFFRSHKSTGSSSFDSVHLDCLMTTHIDTTKPVLYNFKLQF